MTHDVLFGGCLKHPYGLNMRCMRKECGETTFYSQEELQKRWSRHRNMPMPLFNQLWRCPVCGEKSPGGAKPHLSSPHGVMASYGTKRS
ncbi:MAG: hypothetical protein AAFR65_10410 [Pseudomonadota bacterium]